MRAPMKKITEVNSQYNICCKCKFSVGNKI